VAYRSGALADMRGITAAAHDAGALALWDLSHAVGCTYKYLNSGPGGPAFLYVRRDLQERLDQPLWGWMGQHDQFEMGPRYEPAAGIRRFLVGTPPILSMVAAEEGIRLAAEAGIERLRAKGMAMTAYLVDLADAWLAPLGFSVATPRDPSRRGSHVGLRHADAWRICRAAIERARVVPDFRTPDVIRVGPAPLYTRFTEVHDAMERIRDLVASGESDATDAARARVT
jgi:kynureninase